MKNNIIAIDVSREYIFHVDKVIERSKRDILEWFNLPLPEFKVTTYIYKDNESLREGLKKRGLGLFPAHMVACMIDQDEEKGIRRSINFYEPNPKSAIEYNKKEYDEVITHELTHYITDILYGKLPEWLTEGIAKIIDKYYKDDLTNLMKLINNYEIPDITTMKGDFFILKKQEEVITDEGILTTEKIVYDGYDLGYIMVRYIIETLGKDYLFTLMSNKDELALKEQSILSEAIEYYNCQYGKENTINI